MSTPTNHQQVDLNYVRSTLLMELQDRMTGWNKEYTQPRDLGVVGEWVGLYRKARKLKSILWDGHDASTWREGTRTMFMEIAAHALLAVRDIDADQEKQECKQNHDDDSDDGDPTRFHRPDQTKWMVTASFNPNNDRDRQWSLDIERIEDEAAAAPEVPDPRYAPGSDW